MLEPTLPDIPSFYKGKSVFITGGTGFMGKVLVERLLTSCPGIKNIYLLIRKKKGLIPEKRLQQLKHSQVFDVLRANHPAQLDKLVAVPGDVTEKQLGLTSAALRTISEVSIIFHSAATVKLQGELRQSVDQNLCSVIALLQICDTLPKVDVFVHVSTAYSNAELSRVEEKVYPPPADLRILLDMMEDENMTQEQFEKLTASKPNTYTFTKAMAEHVVERHGCKNFPMAIFRPTIVISSLRHPFPGWIENLNGPSGVIAGVTTGLLRVVRSRGDARADMVPVDIATDTLIAAAWETAMDKPSKVRVYHCSTIENPTTWEDFRRTINSMIHLYPSSKALWYPNVLIFKNRFIHRVLEKLLQSAPLYLIEYVTRIFGVKMGRNLIQVNGNLKAMNKALEYFAVREWDFVCENSKRLRNRLSESDRELLNLEPNTINWAELYASFVKGTRKYVMREQDRDIVAARNRLRMLNVIHTAVKVIFTLGSLRLINHWLSVKHFINQLCKTFVVTAKDVTCCSHFMPLSQF